MLLTASHAKPYLGFARPDFRTSAQMQTLVNAVGADPVYCPLSASITKMLTQTPRVLTSARIMPRSWHDAGGRESMRSGRRRRAHDSHTVIPGEQSLDQPWRPQRPPPRHPRIHILQKVVAVPCDADPHNHLPSGIPHVYSCTDTHPPRVVQCHALQIHRAITHQCTSCALCMFSACMQSQG